MLRQDTHVGAGDVRVLPAEHLEVGDADDVASLPRDETAVLLRPVVVEGPAQALGPEPSRTLGSALQVRDVQHGEPLVERAAVGGVDCADLDRGGVGHVGLRLFCQNMPTPATSKPSMSLTAIIGALLRRSL